MRNLIKSEFYKQKVNGVLSLYLVLMSIVGIGISFINVLDEGTYSYFYDYNYLISNSMIIYMVIATIAAFYHVKDFNEKSIQHAIMSGYTRKDVIFSKTVVLNIISTLAFSLYTVLGILTSILMNNSDFTCEYKGSVIIYVILTFIFKVLFIIAFNALCMLFCYLVRNAAAYFLVILSLWISFIGPAYKTTFVASHSTLQAVFKSTIMVQDQMMFADKLSSGIYNITFHSASIYVIVMIITIIILYKLTCAVLSKVEII